MATYTGTSGNDNLAGTSAADLILGNMGNDNLVGNGGEDSIYGGMGNDFIRFGPITGGGAVEIDTSSDIIYGGLGKDTIQSNGTVAQPSSFGFNTIYGGTGDAVQDATDGSNLINLAAETNGADIIFAGGGGDSILLGGVLGSSVTGGAGNDTINANGERGAIINANAGADSVTGSAGGGDSIHGGQGNDTIQFGGTTGSLVAADLNNDSVRAAGAGDNTIYGGKGNDTIQLAGGTGNDLVFAGLDSDTIAVASQVTVSNGVASGAADSIYGGTDTTGTAADSSNFISASNVALGAGAGYTNAAGTAVAGVAVAANGLGNATGRDLLVGGGGNDTIVASSSGNTFLPTGAAAGAVQPTAVDTLTGGGGNDLFAFGPATGAQGYSNVNATTASSVDSVTDFVSGSDQFKFGTTAATIAVDNTGNAQTSVNNSGATTLAQAATAVLTGVGGATALAASTAAIFNYGGTNFLLANTGGTLATDYLINVGSVTNVTTRDING